MSRRKSDAETDARAVHRKDSRGKNRTVTAAPSITRKKTIAITPEAYDELTRRAENAGTDRKTLASRAILDPTTNQDSHENPNLEERLKRVAERYLDKLEQHIDDDAFEPTVREFGQIVRTMKDLDGMPSEASSEPYLQGRWNELNSRRYDSAGGTDKE
ncbi:MAG TPA: hypothetical protein ENN68_09960 [Methanomicrobia archaeon]|nr:hypothetical protein [Methanomicrobia archaeon]